MVIHIENRRGGDVLKLPRSSPSITSTVAMLNLVAHRLLNILTVAALLFQSACSPRHE